tara:strand:+ start:464 stop:790 length:327 start_codon:yes stop_codon:yes gene_type:complete
VLLAIANHLNKYEYDYIETQIKRTDTMFITDTQFELAIKAMKVATDKGIDVYGVNAIDLHNYVVSGRDNNGVIIEAEKGGFFHINANTQAIRKATYEEGADEHTVGWR